MELFLGKWIFKKDVHFGEFLKFSGVPWIKRQIAGHNKINIFIEKWKDVYIKTVSSPFYNVEEIIKLDGKYKEYEYSFKKYSTENDIIYVSVNYKDSIFWEEEIYIKDSYLIIKYIWTQNNERHIAVQFFKRK